MVGAVTGYVNTRYLGADLGVGLRNEVAQVISRDGVPEEAGVGDVPDSDENSLAGDFLGFPGLGILYTDSTAFAIVAGQDLFRYAVPKWFNFLILQGAVGHDLGCPELVPTVDEGDFGAKAGQEKSFFAGRIATADYNDIHVPVERPVTGCARGDALAAKHFLLTGDAQQTWGGSGCDDDRLGLVSFVCRLEDFDIPGKVHALNPVTCETCTKTFGLAAYLVHERISIDPLREAREIFNLGGGRKLPSGLGALQDEWVKVGASSVDGGGESSAAGSEDDDVFHIVCVDVGGFLGN